MATVFSFAFVTEVTMNNASRFPEKWGLTEKAITENKVVKGYMPVHHSLLNYLHGNKSKLKLL